MYNVSETIALVNGLSAKRLNYCLDQGWIYASIGDSGPGFGDIDIARLSLICTLQNDMEIDDDMLPTILSLIDQVYGLRSDLRNIMQVISSEPDDIKQRFMAKLM